MGEPLVSVIVTTYNYSHYIRDALQSVLKQTYRHFEIVVVDDGSQDVDVTRQIIAELNDDRITLIAKAQNGGLSAARNTGMAAAKGSIFAFLDADDVFLPHKLAVQTTVLESNPSAVMVFSDEYHMTADGIIDTVPVHQQRGEPILSDDLVVAYLRSSFIAVFTVLVRRAVIDSVGVFDVSLPQNEDDDLWLRIMMAGPVLYSEYVSGARRQHGGNMSHDRSQLTASQCATFAKLAQQHPDFMRQHRRIVQQRIRRLAIRYLLGQIRRRQPLRLSVLRHCVDTHRLVAQVGAPK